MNSTVSNKLADMPLRNAKCESRRGEGAVQKLNPEAGAALRQAQNGAELEVKQMAGTMDVSDSLVYRALGSKDDIGFHRLWELSDEFWAELLIAIAKRRRVAIVKTTLELYAEKKRA